MWRAPSRRLNWPLFLHKSCFILLSEMISNSSFDYCRQWLAAWRVPTKRIEWQLLPHKRCFILLNGMPLACFFEPLCILNTTSSEGLFNFATLQRTRCHVTSERKPKPQNKYVKLNPSCHLLCCYGIVERTSSVRVWH